VCAAHSVLAACGWPSGVTQEDRQRKLAEIGSDNEPALETTGVPTASAKYIGIANSAAEY